MTRAAEIELERFLAAHPEVRFFDAFVNDLNTVERGKRIDRAAISARVRARHAPARLDVRARHRGRHRRSDGTGLRGWRRGPPLHAHPRHAGAGALAIGRHRAGAAHACTSCDGTPFFGDPRHLLGNVLARFTRLGLTPVVAIEYEFYLVDTERARRRPAAAAEGPADGTARVPHADQLDDGPQRILAAAQRDRSTRVAPRYVPTTSALAEYGPGQYEVNLSARAGHAARLR